MDIINKPIGWILKIFSNISGGNYLVAILLFAVLFEIILLPFGIKQQKNSIKQARMRPKEMAIRKKYAGRDDKVAQQKMAMEIQELYQKEGYNPLSGCLPLLIQFPLLIALYNIVINPLKYICGLSDTAIDQIATITGGNTAGGTMSLLGSIRSMGFGAFKNVEGFSREIYDSIPNLDLGFIDLSVLPKDCMNLESFTRLSGILVLAVPVLTFLAYFFSMKISRKLMYQPVTDGQAAGCSNKMMDIMMPLFSVFISFGVPAALGIYWIAKSLLGVVKQVILYFAMPIPKFTEEDYKAAEKEMGTRNEKNTKVQKSGRVVRSLHHIDDEDFEDTAEAGRLRREALEAQAAAENENAAKKTKGVIAEAPLKEDKSKASAQDDNK